MGAITAGAGGFTTAGTGIGAGSTFATGGGRGGFTTTLGFAGAGGFPGTGGPFPGGPWTAPAASCFPFGLAASFPFGLAPAFALFLDQGFAGDLNGDYLSKRPRVRE